MPNPDINLSPYTAESESIARRMKMAELLQQQSMQPLETPGMAGGYQLRTSPYAGLAKILQGYTAMQAGKGAEAERKALGERYKTESSDAMRLAYEAGAGTPAVAERNIPESSFVPSGSDLTDIVPPTRVPQGDPGEGNIVQPAYTIPGRAAVAPNLERMAQLLMNSPNPAHQASGLQQMQKNAQMQAFINAGNAGNAPAPSAAPAAAVTPGGTPSPAGAALGNSPFGSPAGGQPMAVWMAIDPTGAKYNEQRAKDFTDQNKPTDKIRELIAAGIKPGSDAWNFALTDTATQGGIWRRGADGALYLAPGYAAGQAAVTTATKGAEAGFEIVEIPVTQADGTTILRKMTKEQAIKQLGGGAPSQSGPLVGPTSSAPTGFGVSNPVQEKTREAAAIGSIKAITDRLESSFASALASEERMRQVQSMRPILDLPLISGPGATPQMFLSQVASKIYGVTNEETLANTRQLITGLSELSLASRGALKGQGPITEGEQVMLMKARSAPDSLTVPEYKRLFALFEKQDNRAIAQHEDMRKRAEKAGIPNIDFWRVDVPLPKEFKSLSPAALKAVREAQRLGDK